MSASQKDSFASLGLAWESQKLSPPVYDMTDITLILSNPEKHRKFVGLRHPT